MISTSVGPKFPDVLTHLAKTTDEGVQGLKRPSFDAAESERSYLKNATHVSWLSLVPSSESESGIVCLPYRCPLNVLSAGSFPW